MKSFGLSDELQEVILDHLSNDGRVDLEGVEISCRNGVVYLEGTIPSKTQQQILLKILIDVLGFLSIVDHLLINELIWEREDRHRTIETAKASAFPATCYDRKDNTLILIRVVDPRTHKSGRGVGKIGTGSGCGEGEHALPSQNT